MISWIIFISINRKSADWNFIKYVGGIKTEKPIETEDGYYLPVICNVSGWDSITVKPKAVNSALFCLKTKVKIIENKIYLTVITGIPVSGNLSSKSRAVGLGNLKDGNYKIYYQDKENTEHLIGEFSIEKQIR